MVSKTIDAARKGFAVDATLINSIQGQIADDGRVTFSKVVLSSDAIRTFRARHRELTFWTAEQVYSVRLQAEIYCTLELSEAFCKLYRSSIQKSFRTPGKFGAGTKPQ